jgi:6-phosphogluconolactonase (cycloisomerase 2 family)
VTYSGKDVEAFDVGANGGLFHKDPLHGEANTGVNPYGIALSPDNRNAYVPNYNSAGASTLSIDDIAADGSIKLHNPPTVPAGAGPDGVAVSRDGKSVYVAAQDGHVYMFNRAANGSLTPKTPAFVTVHGGTSAIPGWIALAPDGRHAYIAYYDSSEIGIFNVAADGRLTEQPSSPISSGYGFYEMAMSPNGKSLYAASNTDGKVYQYTVLANGFLKAKMPKTRVAGVSLDGIWLTPSGRNAYVANQGTYPPSSHHDYDIAQFNVGATGLLAPKTPATVAADEYPSAVAVTPDQSPIASFKWSRKRGLRKKFDASASRDGDGRVVRFAWSFGDGKLATATKPTLRHRYKKAGKYTVSLRVVDNAFCSVPLVWTGQTAYCRGNPRAVVKHRVTVKKKRKKHHHHKKKHH